MRKMGKMRSSRQAGELRTRRSSPCIFFLRLHYNSKEQRGMIGLLIVICSMVSVGFATWSMCKNSENKQAFNMSLILLALGFSCTLTGLFLALTNQNPLKGMSATGAPASTGGGGYGPSGGAW